MATILGILQNLKEQMAFCRIYSLEIYFQHLQKFTAQAIFWTGVFHPKSVILMPRLYRAELE